MFLYEYEYCLAESILNRKDTKKTRFPLLFSYTGTCQAFKLPVKGTMTMQCWGASGGSLSIAENNYPTNTVGGNGGYTEGIISGINHYTELYVYVGAQGKSMSADCIHQTFNGGGGSRGFDRDNYDDIYADPHTTSQGGGATDIRLLMHTIGTWGYLNENVSISEQGFIEDNGLTDESLYTRLIVAGGGGGANRYAYWDSPNMHYGDSEGGAAGGLKGYGGKTAACSGTRIEPATNSTGGTQTAGGDGWKYNGTYSLSNNGQYGYGGIYGTFGGGGGGYYGGGTGGSNICVVGSGAGGSSYVSGHGGCSTLTYSGKTYTFTSPEIWDGLGYKWNNSAATSTRGFPNTAGSGTENGHIGNGYAKITLITPVND